MNLNLENYLHAIDSNFKNKSDKDKYMVYIMIFSSIFAFSYLLFWDNYLSSFNQQIITGVIVLGFVVISYIARKQTFKDLVHRI
jgi:hypothetical protein